MLDGVSIRFQLVLNGCFDSSALLLGFNAVPINFTWILIRFELIINGSFPRQGDPDVNPKIL